MTVEQLMQPRVILTNWYPGCQFEVGEVLQLKTIHALDYGAVYSNGIRFENADAVEKSPANFRPLQWWENRKPEDMPQYVKSEHSAYATKSIDWQFTVFWTFKNSGGGNEMVQGFAQATEQEYTDYLASKTK